MISDRVPSVKTQCHWRLRGSSKQHSITLNNNDVYCWILEVRHARVFSSVTLSACCTTTQGSPSITLFQHCDFLQQHSDILNVIQLSHIFHYNFLFSYLLPTTFLFLTPFLPFSVPSIGPSFIVYMFVNHLSSTPLITFMFL